MGRGREFVLVLDADGRFLEYVEPAVARKALKEGAVEVATTDPFTLRAPPGMTRVPRLFKGSRSSNVSFDKFSKIFAEEQPLYVKTLVPGQVSIEIQVGPGMTEPVRVPHTGDPVCLTDIAPFDALKRSMDLRKLASPRKARDGKLKPPAIRILTHEEVTEHYRQKAVDLGYTTPEGEPDIERASAPVYTDEAITKPATSVDIGKSATEEMLEQHGGPVNLGKEGQVAVQEVVHPRVLHLCSEVSADVPENQKMSADALLTELRSLGELNPESLNHLLSFGFYKSVKTWASKQLQERAASEE